MRRWILLALIVASSTNILAQRRFEKTNGIGLMGGVNFASLQTSNFNTNPDLGWNAGFFVRGSFYNNFDMVYGIQFIESNFSVETLNSAMAVEDVKYKIPGGQISLLVSYNIIVSHLSVEVGPVFQFNGKMSLDEASEGNAIKGTTLKAGEIVDISPFNFHAAIGLTGGLKKIRLSVQYLYGINNILNNLNEQNLGYDFEGRFGIISGNIIVLL